MPDVKIKCTFLTNRRRHEALRHGTKISEGHADAVPEVWEVLRWDEGAHTPVQQGGETVPQVREDFCRNEEARTRLQNGKSYTSASRAEAQPSYSFRWTA
jgi:hypothetical protein